MRAWVLLVLLASCRERSAPQVSRDDAGAPSPAALVRYDCGFVSIEPTDCAASPDWIADLDRYGSVFIEPGEGEPSEEVCTRIEAALDRALADDLSRLDITERIVAQNGALRAVGPRTCKSGTSKKAAQAVLRLAPPAASLSELGSEPFTDMEEWLGPRASWIDRKAEQSPLFHDVMEFYTQAFRPVRSGSMRAVISQMIAIDTGGKVHVTPIVGRIELREDEALDAPACVGKLDATKLRCNRGRVRPLAEDRLPHNVFVNRPAPGFVDCNRCHAVPDAHANLVDLPAAERDRLAERRTRFLGEAAAGFESIRRKAE